MSHQGSDFLIEAVMNSIEASAGKIVIKCTVLPDSVSFDVEDDGDGIKCGDVFGEGVSTKGNGRGRGLYLLKKTALEAAVMSNGEGTCLSMRLAKEDLGLLSDVLPIIFTHADDGVAVTFTMRRGNEVFTLDSDELKKEFGVLSRVSSIAEIRKRSSQADELIKES